ncbi:hypothetical protein BH18ACI5_BH18ACI5_01210 [soil metagenome]
MNAPGTTTPRPPTLDSRPMLQLRRLYKTFNPGTPNEVRALQGVELELEERSFVTVIGGNGSGKSTLLNAVAGTFFVDGIGGPR